MEDADAPLGLFTLRHPDVIADPYPFYARIRREGPAMRDSIGVWLVSHYAAVLDALSDPNVSANRLDQVRDLRPDRDHPEIVELFRSIKRQILFMDAPLHTRIRALASKAFTPARIERMRATVERIVGELLDRALGSGSFDAIADLAVPLPLTLICEVLGVPAEDRARLKAWSSDYAVFLGGTIGLTEEQMLHLARSMREFTGYFEALAEHRRAAPGDDLFSALLSAEDGGDGFERADLAATCAMLITAGHETTTNLIGNGLLALLRHPAAMARLRAEPSLMGSALDELLRYDSPVQLSARRAAADVSIAGVAIPAGSVMYLLLGAANHDEARFADPRRLDLTRANNRHLSFGQGAHYCIGATLARLEAGAALHALLGRTRAIALREETPTFRRNAALRGLTALPLAVDAI